MPSTDAERPKSEEDDSGIAGTLLVGGLVLLFVIAIVALIYFAVKG